MPKSETNIKYHDEWRLKMYKPGYLELSENEIELMLQGAIYVSGTDKKNRPILVINTQKILLLNVNLLIYFIYLEKKRSF